jgi:hypothetical protein
MIRNKAGMSKNVILFIITLQMSRVAKLAGSIAGADRGFPGIKDLGAVGAIIMHTARPMEDVAFDVAMKFNRFAAERCRRDPDYNRQHQNNNYNPFH